MKVEKGSFSTGPKTESAATEAGLRDYAILRRSVSAQTLFLTFPVAALVAVRAPTLGIDLAVGGVCGVAYMLATMRAGERLLDGVGSSAAHVTGSVVRVLLFGALPVMTAIKGPWWAMGVYYAGFFTPLFLYARSLNRQKDT